MSTPVALFRDRRGTAAVEFAILTPVFLLMLFGMVAYGIYFGAVHSISQLAADAARTAISGISAGERDRLVAGFLDRNAGLYMLIDADRLRYEIGDKPDDPEHYRVTLLYDAGNLPIWALSPPLPLPSQHITYTSTIRRGGI
jgi:Flp pilus assembly protein TadG